MTLIYENNAIYDPETDPVSTISVQIKCNPKQVDSTVDFLAGLENKAGIYHASFEVGTLKEVQDGTADVSGAIGLDIGGAREISNNQSGGDATGISGDADAILSATADSSGDTAALVDNNGQDQSTFANDTVGGANGESEIQSNEHETTVIGQGRYAEEGAIPEIGTSGEDGELAGLAGEDRPKQGKRSNKAKDLS